MASDSTVCVPSPWVADADLSGEETAQFFWVDLHSFSVRLHILT